MARDLRLEPGAEATWIAKDGRRLEVDGPLQPTRALDVEAFTRSTRC